MKLKLNQKLISFGSFARTRIHIFSPANHRLFILLFFLAAFHPSVSCVLCLEGWGEKGLECDFYTFAPLNQNREQLWQPIRNPFNAKFIVCGTDKRLKIPRKLLEYNDFTVMVVVVAMATV